MYLGTRFFIFWRHCCNRTRICSVVCLKRGWLCVPLVDGVWLMIANEAFSCIATCTYLAIHSLLTPWMKYTYCHLSIILMWQNSQLISSFHMFSCWIPLPWGPSTSWFFRLYCPLPFFMCLLSSNGCKLRMYLHLATSSPDRCQPAAHNTILQLL